MNLNENEETDRSTLEEPTHQHGFMMTLIHMAPMFVLFAYYDDLRQTGNELWYYGLIVIIVISHVWMLMGMFQNKKHNEHGNQFDKDSQNKKE